MTGEADCGLMLDELAPGMEACLTGIEFGVMSYEVLRPLGTVIAPISFTVIEQNIIPVGISPGAGSAIFPCLFWIFCFPLSPPLHWGLH